MLALADYGSEYYQVVVTVSVAIAALAVIHAIIWVHFESKQKEKRDEHRQKRS
jgi:hypothetical protein